MATSGPTTAFSIPGRAAAGASTASNLVGDASSSSSVTALSTEKFPTATRRRLRKVGPPAEQRP